MKKIIALALAAMMALSMISFAAAEDVVTLDIIAWDANTTPYLTAQKEAYEASHPGVVINYIDVASQNYDEKVFADLAAGSSADIVMVKDIPALLNWYNAGFLANMNDMMAAANYDVSGFVGMETNYAFEGNQVALPFRSDFEILFYNKGLFDEKGVAYPTIGMTWDQYKEMAIAMTWDKEDGTHVYGTHYHTWLSTAVNYTVADGVNTLVDGDYSDLAYFYQLILDLEDAEACMAFPELKAAGLHYSGAFGNGNIAMMPMGYWYVATLIKNIAEGAYDVQDWGICALPTLEGVKAGSTFGNLTGAAINVKSTKQQAAFDYIAWLCGDEGAQVTAATGNRPAWVSEGVAAVMSSVEGFPQDETSIATLLPTYVAIEIPGMEYTTEISNILSEVHSEIMNREVEVDEGVAEMTERVQELLAK